MFSGGGGWVLFHKPRHAKFEVYNDLDSNLVNLFRALQKDAEAVIKKFEFTLNSIEILKEIKEVFDAGDCHDKVTLAANFFLLTKLSYGNRRVTYSYQEYDVRTAFDPFRAAHNRLAGIIIDNRDFERVIRHYDSPDAFFYCDPPYFEAENFYKVPFSLEDHQRLRELLGSIQGKFLLSYNDCHMNKPTFNVLDDKGRIVIPQPLRASLGFEKEDVVGITADKGKITVKKAVVMADDNMPIEAKACYVQAVVREFDSKALVGLLELIAKLIQSTQNK